MSLQPTPSKLNISKKKSNKAGEPLTVRMYDVGFGDCFLLLIPKPDGKKYKVLFDCGSIKLGENSKSMKEMVKLVIKEVKDTSDGSPRIDVLVATHRHKDHISGFDDPAWAEVEVGEVWMPWTEKPNDPKARKIRELHARLAENLVNRLKVAISDDSTNMAAKSSFEMAMNAMSNEGAMNTLYNGFANDPQMRYLPEENASATWFTTPTLPGVTINVLGPSHDPDVITEMDPPAGQSYLKMVNSELNETMMHPLPFRKDWAITPDEYQIKYPFLFNDLSNDDRKYLELASFGMDEGMASVLDRALNGTSLVLVFQIGKAVLLFPGDAQWGSWHLALDNPDLRKLLKTVTFYKVGHHGSHNATPVEFVQDIMGKNVLAMISVNPTSNWPMVPKEDLITELQKKEGCKIARSDKPEEAVHAGFTLIGEGVIEAQVPI
ncbi:MAG: hypothetical protein C0410_03805 [Anaerolinea sp.]|nr:hypothetical protein [Anaerolinea sp.]